MPIAQNVIEKWKTFKISHPYWVNVAEKVLNFSQFIGKNCVAHNGLEIKVTFQILAFYFVSIIRVFLDRYLQSGTQKLGSKINFVCH